ncbi:MAG: tRNA 2-thiouridine(34) synthase MnmA [Patescibacteria group bacterium]|nr:tRNA 2-thiouridine(34) synthase MnmA [Patescibacteria group bacterium]
MKKAFVGMSGGVDSSVSAALLKRAGYDVTGVFIKVWQPDWIECDWREERLDAMRAAAHLRIPFVTLDLEAEYKKEVIDYMISEYRAGRTPNPDVMCNRYVKFGAFWRWAAKNGADFIATGHYARIEERGGGSREEGVRRAGHGFRLLAGSDPNKDQSYFLWTLTQDDLSHTLFPVGGLLKSEVRSLARKFGLPNADKKDSQGLCFIGKVDVKAFLAHYIKSEPGDVIDDSGKKIGKHPGSVFFTIGERHGFMIDPDKRSPNDQPYYVVSKDVVNNTITVSNKEGGDRPSASDAVRLSKANWISGSAPGSADRSMARSRYRQPLQALKEIECRTTETKVVFEKAQESLTPGQSLVIYRGEECLGGGIIE